MNTNDYMAVETGTIPLDTKGVSTARVGDQIKMRQHMG